MNAVSSLPSARQRYWLLGVSLAAALSFWLQQSAQPSTWTLLLKTGAIVALALWTWPQVYGAGRLLPLALLSHATGDGLLEAERVSGISLFLPAMGAFLVGHLLYLGLFGRLSARRWVHLRLLWLIPFLTLPVGAVILHAVWFGGQPLALQLAVPVYMTVLLCMATMSLRQHAVVVAFGAFGYLVSDGLVGLDKFTPVFAQLGLPGGWLIWPVYYLAQLLLACGLAAALDGAKR
jgi:uncharacterized membrane protein YhhN